MPINTYMWILPMQHVPVWTFSASHAQWLPVSVASRALGSAEWPCCFWGTNSHSSVGLRVWSSRALLIQIPRLNLQSMTWNLGGKSKELTGLQKTHQFQSTAPLRGSSLQSESRYFCFVCNVFVTWLIWSTQNKPGVDRCYGIKNPFAASQ